MLLKLLLKIWPSFIPITVYLIWVLVIAKVLCSYVFELAIIADVIMCMIVGIMGGRLGGIGRRVRKLKVKHNL